ncbi:MAG: hypothetical protein GTO02_06275, partial [Candidatus Dadabacteria bacterium]|nr:hypothetical protein [Candidatus Dadabacteria bacterium]
IPQFGIFGAAWATLISFLTRLLYVYFASQKLFKIDYQLFKPFQVFLLGAFIYLIYFFEIKLFPSTNDLLWVIPRVGV